MVFSAKRHIMQHTEFIDFANKAIREADKTLLRSFEQSDGTYPIHIDGYVNFKLPAEREPTRVPFLFSEKPTKVPGVIVFTASLKSETSPENFITRVTNVISFWVPSFEEKDP